ncbi:LIM and SH3 domain protein 1 isoform X1 [Notechis scutatus]|uniref:LIM and SH3 domain protein 1 n=1 Tax=Notechis scutatus TaxID=8663 RepID=A0A6J1U575_9SAUR|nr:LIM and SH3 domain protein 1 isoform X1 [Notechis scutatus]
MNPSCARCGKIVYPTEKVNCLDKYWHKACFHCEVCKMTLNMKNYKGYGKKPYCNAHYPKQSFTMVADTPENLRLKQQSELQSQVPALDSPVVALVAFSSNPADPEEALKAEDKRIEQSLQGTYQAATWAVKASSAASFLLEPPYVGSGSCYSRADTEVQPTSRGHVCFSKQFQAAQILHQVPDPRCGRDQRCQEQMSSGPSVCLFSSSAAASGNLKNPGGGGGVILLTPYWPQRLWFWDLVNLSITNPWRIPPDKISLHQGALVHPEPQWLQLTAWCLSRAL